MIAGWCPDYTPAHQTRQTLVTPGRSPGEMDDSDTSTMTCCMCRSRAWSSGMSCSILSAALSGVSANVACREMQCSGLIITGRHTKDVQQCVDGRFRRLSAQQLLLRRERMSDSAAHAPRSSR